MFKNLTNFSYTRSWKEAIGFYLAYFLVGLILGGSGGAWSAIQSGATTFDEGFSSGLNAGAAVSIVYSLAIAILLLIQKKLYKNFGYVILALLSGALAAFGGLLLGFIIPAFLTTRGTISTEEPPK